MKKQSTLIITGILLIIIDRLTKIFFREKNFSIFNYSENYNLAFGILKNNIFIIILTLIIIFILISLYLKNKNSKIRLSLILILSGVISNLVDRIFLGYVIDFIDLGFWPIFNLADLYSTIGVILLIINFKKW